MIFFELFILLAILLGIAEYILKTMDRKKRKQKIVEDWYHLHYPHGDDGKIYEDDFEELREKLQPIEEEEADDLWPKGTPGFEGAKRDEWRSERWKERQRKKGERKRKRFEEKLIKRGILTGKEGWEEKEKVIQDFFDQRVREIIMGGRRRNK